MKIRKRCRKQQHHRTILQKKLLLSSCFLTKRKNKQTERLLTDRFLSINYFEIRKRIAMYYNSIAKSDQLPKMLQISQAKFA